MAVASATAFRMFDIPSQVVAVKVNRGITVAFYVVGEYLMTIRSLYAKQ